MKEVVLHCPKNDQNLSLKTELVRVGADVRVAVCWTSGPDLSKQKPDVYRCIRSSRDRIGRFIETKARRIPLHPLQPWQNRSVFFMRRFRLFWNSVVACKEGWYFTFNHFIWYCISFHRTSFPAVYCIVSLLWGLSLQEKKYVCTKEQI